MAASSSPATWSIPPGSMPTLEDGTPANVPPPDLVDAEIGCGGSAGLWDCSLTEGHEGPCRPLARDTIQRPTADPWGMRSRITPDMYAPEPLIPALEELDASEPDTVQGKITWTDSKGGLHAYEGGIIRSSLRADMQPPFSLSVTPRVNTAEITGLPRKLRGLLLTDPEVQDWLARTEAHRQEHERQSAQRSELRTYPWSDEEPSLDARVELHEIYRHGNPRSRGGTVVGVHRDINHVYTGQVSVAWDDAPWPELPELIDRERLYPFSG
jgi:hypothetical protein